MDSRALQRDAPTPIYFAQVREDSRIERGLAEAHGLRRIVCIASGGCTALSLLRDGVDYVAAIDLNPAQCALLELKKAAIRSLERDAYLEFVAQGNARGRLDVYRELRQSLPAEARAFWDERPRLLELGINHSGVTESFYRFVGGNLVGGVLAGELWRRLLDCTSVPEQRALYHDHCANDAFRMALRMLLSRTTHLQFYPEFMFENVSENHYGDFFAQQLLAEIESRPLAGNYFVSQLLFGEYLLEKRGGCPPYLEPANYGEARRNIDALRVHTGGIESSLRSAPGADAVFLSNVFDWATAEKSEGIAAAAVEGAAPGALVLWRNMLAEMGVPRAFASGLVVDRAASERARADERSLLYRSVTVGRVKAERRVA